MIITLGSTRLNILKKIIKLSSPLILSQMLRLLTATIATIMVAKLGTHQLAAIGLGYTFYIMIMLFCIGVLFSVGIMVGHAYGAKNDHDLEQGIANGLWLACFLSIPVILLLYFGHYFFLITHQNLIIVNLTQGFLSPLTFGVLPLLAGATLQQLLLGISCTRVLNFFAITSVLLNTFFCYAFIFGQFGFPRLELAGVGYSISLSAWINFTVMLIYINYSPLLAKFNIMTSFLKHDLSIVPKLFLLGWPIGVTLIVEQLAFFILVIFIGMLSTIALAAYQIVDQFLLIALMIPVAISQATTILVSQSLGKGAFNEVRQTTLIAILFSLFLILFFSLLFWLMPSTLTGWFLQSRGHIDARIFYFSTTMLAITGIIQLCDAIRMIFSGALRGIRDVQVPLLISIIAFLGVDIPLATAVAFLLKWGAIAVWGVDFFGVGLATILLWWRFNKKTKVSFN